MRKGVAGPIEHAENHARKGVGRPITAARVYWKWGGAPNCFDEE
jgi:hypothetical protein